MLDKEIEIGVSEGALRGTLSIPEEGAGLVLFAHGSGSGRRSPRNRYVAGILNSRGIATLLFDLLTEKERLSDIKTGKLRFNIDLLSRRLSLATHWIEENRGEREFNTGYFGASTGAAAALVAAADQPEIMAVVSRGGRTDLAGDALSYVTVPTLLIVGENDCSVLEMNRKAAESLQTEKRLEIIPGAGHLFEEPGKLDQAAVLAAEWFERYLHAAPSDQEG